MLGNASSCSQHPERRQRAHAARTTQSHAEHPTHTRIRRQHPQHRLTRAPLLPTRNTGPIARLTLPADRAPRGVVHIDPVHINPDHDYAALFDALTGVRPVALNDRPDKVCPRSFRNEYGDTRRLTSCT